jgi:hypothetical protein
MKKGTDTTYMNQNIKMNDLVKILKGRHKEEIQKQIFYPQICNVY